MASSHTDLIREAKANQINELKRSAAYSRQLVNTVSALVKSNSEPDSNALIDKITTIHQLNADIDRQLNQDIARSFYDLMKCKKDITTLINKCLRIISGPELGNLIADLQSQTETVDQELRILENTLKLVRANRGR